MNEHPDPAASPPPYALHSAGNVYFGSLGTAVAGCVLLAINFSRLGRKGAAWLSVLTGAAVTAAVVIWVIEHGWQTGILLAQGVAMWLIAKQTQGTAIAFHAASGGRLVSWVWAVALGVGTLACVLATMYFVGVERLMSQYVEFGPNQRVAYLDDATEADARRLGEHLRGMGYFVPGRDTHVLVRKTADDVEVTFVVVEDAWTKPEALTFYRLIGESVGSMLGKAIVVHLADARLETRHTIDLRGRAPP